MGFVLLTLSGLDKKLGVILIMLAQHKKLEFPRMLRCQEFLFGRHQVVLETGRIARQANTVLVTMGGVTVLVAVVAAKSAKSGQDFFPLTVDYQEKTYAAGRIPGGYFKREGRASEKL